MASSRRNSVVIGCRPLNKTVASACLVAPGGINGSEAVWLHSKSALASGVIAVYLRAFFGDHDGRRSGVARRNGRHHRGVDDADAVEPEHAQPLVNHGHGIAVAAHFRG